MVKVATMRDVAVRAGVSVTTVSRVLNGTGYVKAATRRAVEAAIADLGYLPSGSARQLVTRRTGMLGLCLPDTGPVADLRAPVRVGHRVEVVPDHDSAGTVSWGGLYFGEVVRGAEYAAWQAGFAITVAVARPPEADARIRELAGRVDGLIVVAGTQSDGLLDHLAHRVPVVLVAVDGVDAGRTCSPRLTTVEQPMADLGRLAVDVLRACLADPRLPRQERTAPVRVLLRDSCGPH
ncbi:LacI family DNA-binding transcriptional regulator [Streptomyces carpaticus]|uniref:LacI family DNA-binding transcriptional regulator n=1 Tax=Streptomyces carpaticus TaxID=285558 RepID=A0ABV4ZLG1_9ACTN